MPLDIITTFSAVVSWASGSIWIKKHNANTNPFLEECRPADVFGAYSCSPASLLFDDLSNVAGRPKLGWSMLLPDYISGSIVAYACYSYRPAKLPATIVSMACTSTRW